MSMIVCSSPEEVPAGWYLWDCALSGGDLRECLQSLMSASGGHLCVRLAAVFMDFSLPCPAGQGETLTLEQLRARQNGAPCYFSPGLCAEYCTFLQGQTAHVLLYDSPDSLRAKFRTAEACGVPMALIEDPGIRRMLDVPREQTGRKTF